MYKYVYVGRSCSYLGSVYNKIRSVYNKQTNLNVGAGNKIYIIVIT